jgi:hypothetical protein
VVTADEQAELRDVVSLMRKHGVRRIPILREGRLVGIVSRSNLLQGLVAREPAVGGATADDETLRTAVTSAIGGQGWTFPRGFRVVADNGIVHVWGSVATDAVRNAARVAAENVAGVRRVENHLTVAPRPNEAHASDPRGIADASPKAPATDKT